MNWGWRITIFLTLFISFIMYMVIYSFGVSSDLVAEDYYNQEIQYQENIEAQKNALHIAEQVFIKSDNNELNIIFPESFNMNVEKGDVSFYRPNNAKLDKSFDLNLNQNNIQSIDKSMFIKGAYKVTIQFISKGETYLFNKEISI